jgi:CheY-like chemotaxis protein
LTTENGAPVTQDDEHFFEKSVIVSRLSDLSACSSSTVNVTLDVLRRLADFVPSGATMVPRVLLIDAHSDTVDLYAEFLRRDGLEVNGCSSTRAAKALLADAEIVITEMNVTRRRDGLAFLRWIRRHPHFRDTPIIVLSACALPRDIARASLAGADAVLTKPCIPDDLIVAISKVRVTVRRKRMATALVPRSPHQMRLVG